MKILKCPTDVQFKEVSCKCGCVFEYGADDVERDMFDNVYVCCPICNERIDADESLIKHSEHINFNKDCYKFGVSDDSIHIDESESEEWINDMFEELRDESAYASVPFSIRATGDTVVIIFKWEDEYQIIRSNKYEEMSVLR